MEVHQLPICFVKDRQESILMIIDDSLFIMRLEDDVDRQKADFRITRQGIGQFPSSREL